MSIRMRAPIRVLPRELAEKIAAGEVVERPASVIKELVENSLDAGATHVRVELEDGGRKRITVLDDGHGIPAEELPLALERHATSKISHFDDLWNLHTMGFRGEALPSIAAVSRFTLESRGVSDHGRRLYLEGGQLRGDDVPETTSPLGGFTAGTLITVEDLFFNVPARLKFLKSKSSEAAHIRELLERIALCNPKTGFTLLSDGRKLFNVAPAAEDARVAKVLETAPSDLETFEAQFEDIRVHGWLDRDGRAPNGRHVYLAVNGRMVRDKLLQQAVLVGLRSRMMEGEYPRAFVAVEVDPADVDVNVHPAKSEVRFRRSRDVFQVLHGALERLSRETKKPFYSASLPTLAAAPLAAPAAPPEVVSAPTSALFPAERVSYKTKEYVAVAIGGLTAAFDTGTPETLSPLATLSPASDAKRADADAGEKASPGFGHLHYIGQLKNTYLLFQDAEGLVVVDQHAAHERVNYERIKDDFIRNGLKAQPLLVSAVVKCKPEDIGLALENADALARLGFEFEAFGDNCLLVRAAPEALAPDRASELFRALLDEIRGSESGQLLSDDPSRLSPKIERILSTSACHASVRAGQALSVQEARGLALTMDRTDSALNCPHGRPASIRLTFSQIEALFKR
ncbi:MAG: DNA mismatch repair endonuclease MutL [Deltaproteobacteria bacterium]|nr:DNA mismatch repair endonuclease MutL [Deltaproteobacteria bacterium]